MIPQSAGRESLTLRTDVRGGDAAAIEALVASTGFFSVAETEIARELAETAANDGPASGYAFVIADAGPRLAGYACFGEIPATDGRFDLYWIAVSPDFQRQGVGGYLLAEAEKQISRAGGVRVYIETSSQPIYEPTRRFYSSAGYALEARLADFYREGDDKLIYLKTLPRHG